MSLILYCHTEISIIEGNPQTLPQIRIDDVEVTSCLNVTAIICPSNLSLIIILCRLGTRVRSNRTVFLIARNTNSRMYSTLHVIIVCEMYTSQSDRSSYFLVHFIHKIQKSHLPVFLKSIRKQPLMMTSTIYSKLLVMYTGFLSLPVYNSIKYALIAHNCPGL
jgi:hypothetical protein